MKQILVTGANRGLGLELAQQFVARGDRVFAGCRDPKRARDLLKIGIEQPDQLTMIPLDVTNPDSIAMSHTIVRKNTNALDILINNAGIYNMPPAPGEPSLGDDDAPQRLGRLEFDAMLAVLRTNAVAPALIAQQYVDLLRAGDSAVIVNITSGMGSLSEKTHGGSYYYATSKAALNMVTRSLAADLRQDGICVLAVDPGWVRTDMAGPSASISPQESARGIIDLIDNLTPAHSGGFYDYSGHHHQW